MAPRVFIDGEAGTTGLQIRTRLDGRRDIDLLTIDPARRKDADARAELLNGADLVVLCLPDEAAREAVSLIRNPDVKVVDASSAHRTTEGWTYGFPEMSGQRSKIAGSRRVSNPGCWPTGLIALIRPLVERGLVSRDAAIGLHGVTGYSGGGKSLIAEYESGEARDVTRLYGLGMGHKHVPEMTVYAGLAHAPLFSPAVGRFAQGMCVEVPLPLWTLPARPSVAALRDAIAEAYAGEAFVEVASADECARLQKAKSPAAGYAAALDPESLNDTNRLRLFVFGSDESAEARLVSIYDNLGKGASGAAVQNLNLMLGLPETAGLS
jgi:N-acetyl-gamma-glutamyl-phosphate reductase